MKSMVVIKSFSNGISVYLDPGADFDSLMDMVGAKFKESSGFFGDARMALSFEGRKLSEEEETRLIERISGCCSLRITCLVGHDDEKDQTYLRAIQKVEALLGDGRPKPKDNEISEDDSEAFHEAKRDEALPEKKKRSGKDLSEQEYTGLIRKRGSEFLRESVKEHQRIEVPGNIVVLGDVSAGSSVIAGGDIIVMGGLYGEAHGGCDLKEGHFIAALELSPSELSIAHCFLAESEIDGKWPIKTRPLPKIAYMDGDDVVISVINRELWKEILNNA